MHINSSPSTQLSIKLTSIVQSSWQCYHDQSWTATSLSSQKVSNRVLMRTLTEAATQALMTSSTDTNVTSTLMAQAISTSATKYIIVTASNLSPIISSQISASEGALAIKSQSDTSSSTALATSTSNQDCKGDTLCPVSKESNESADTTSANILTRTHNISDDTATSAIIHTRTSTPVTISNEGASQ